jgi:hypothetical protein
LEPLARDVVGYVFEEEYGRCIDRGLTTPDFKRLLSRFRELLRVNTGEEE